MTRNFAGFVLALLVACSAAAQDAGGRQELKRTDVAGAPGMELVMSVLEVKPGEELPRHWHHGLEAVYVLEGTTIRAGEKLVPLATGAAILNEAQVPHAGFVVAGEKPLRMLTVHVVEKGKPLTEVVK